MAYTMKTNIASKSNYGNKRNLSSIKYIVIHYTANDGDTDENNGKYFKNNVVGASAQYFVDDDSVTQSVPDDYVAWSVGGNKYSNCSSTGGGKYYGKATNANTLNIEICDDIKNGKIYPSQATIDNAVAFTKTKMKEYNIPASNVIRHFDVTGKSCPAYWVDDTKWKTEFWNKLTTSTSKSTEKVNVTYAVQIDGGKTLPAVKNLEDYAGLENKKITGITMKVDKGSIKYQVHVLGGGWLPYVTGYNWKDHDNGYAGNGKVIDAVRVVYTTPSTLTTRKSKYRVSPIGSASYYDWQLSNTVNKSKGMDGYAGAFGKAIDKFQICIE